MLSFVPRECFIKSGESNNSWNVLSILKCPDTVVIIVDNTFSVSLFFVIEVGVCRYWFNPICLRGLCLVVWLCFDYELNKNVFISSFAVSRFCCWMLGIIINRSCILRLLRCRGMAYCCIDFLVSGSNCCACWIWFFCALFFFESCNQILWLGFG